MSETYDAVRLANFGRDTARAYAAFLRTQSRLNQEINDAMDQGITPVKIAHDMMGRCANQEAKMGLLTVIAALAEMGKIPQSVYEPFGVGIKPRRF